MKLSLVEYLVTPGGPYHVQHLTTSVMNLLKEISCLSDNQG